MDGWTPAVLSSSLNDAARGRLLLGGSLQVWLSRSLLSENYGLECGESLTILSQNHGHAVEMALKAGG